MNDRYPTQMAVDWWDSGGPLFLCSFRWPEDVDEALPLLITIIPAHADAFGSNINRSIIDTNLAALAAKSWTVWGRAGKVSLADLGYTEFGIDEGWEGCKQGVHGTQHDGRGNPITNSTRFPDLKSLVDEGHAKGLKMGWCGCRRPRTPHL